MQWQLQLDQLLGRDDEGELLLPLFKGLFMADTLLLDGLNFQGLSRIDDGQLASLNRLLKHSDVRLFA